MFPEIFQGNQCYHCPVAHLQRAGETLQEEERKSRFLPDHPLGYESWSAQGGWRGRRESQGNSVSISPLDRPLEGKGGRKDRRNGGMDGRREGGNIWKGRLRMEGRRGEERKARDSGIDLKRKQRQEEREQEGENRGRERKEKWINTGLYHAVLSRFSRVWLCRPMDCSQPGSSVRGILQARIQEWVAISFSRN